MLMKLHRNAVTTPRQRAYIQASDKSVAALAREFGITTTSTGPCAAGLHLLCERSCIESARINGSIIYREGGVSPHYSVAPS